MLSSFNTCTCPQCKAEWVCSPVEVGVPGAEPGYWSTHLPFPLTGQASEAPGWTGWPLNFHIKRQQKKQCSGGWYPGTGETHQLPGPYHKEGGLSIIPTPKPLPEAHGKTPFLIFISSLLSQNPLDCNPQPEKPKFYKTKSLIRNQCHIVTAVVLMASSHADSLQTLPLPCYLSACARPSTYPEEWGHLLIPQPLASLTFLSRLLQCGISHKANFCTKNASLQWSKFLTMFIKTNWKSN